MLRFLYTEIYINGLHSKSSDPCSYLGIKTDSCKYFQSVPEYNKFKSITRKPQIDYNYKETVVLFLQQCG